MSSSIISDELTPEGKAFLKEMEDLDKLEVRIGYQDGLVYPDGTSVASVAAWNEFGTENIPARPFLKTSIDDNIEKIQDFLESKVDDLVGGAVAGQVLRQVGIFQKDLVQEKIREGSFAPNAESTIAKKHSDKPLIDTGLLRQSVNYQVKSKGSE